MTQPVNVLIVDDHALFRESVARLLAAEPGIAVAGVCGTLEAASAMLRGAEIDLVLLDYDLGAELGLELLFRPGALGERTRVLMVTGGMGDAATRRAVHAGVDGVVLKHSSPQQLMQAIRQVANGGTWWDPLIAPVMASPVREPAAFTERQTAILSLLLDGLSNKELAARLQISEAAVKASLQELFRKTAVRTRSQLVRIALETCR